MTGDLLQRNCHPVHAGGRQHRLRLRPARDDPRARGGVGPPHAVGRAARGAVLDENGAHRTSQFCGTPADYKRKRCVLHSYMYGLEAHCRSMLCDPVTPMTGGDSDRARAGPEPDDGGPPIDFHPRGPVARRGLPCGGHRREDGGHGFEHRPSQQGPVRRRKSYTFGCDRRRHFRGDRGPNDEVIWRGPWW